MKIINLSGLTLLIVTFLSSKCIILKFTLSLSGAVFKFLKIINNGNV